MPSLWISCLPTREGADPGPPTWAWRFTPRVTRIDESWLLEVGSSQRLFGGWQRLWCAIEGAAQASGWAPAAAATTALGALAVARCGAHHHCPEPPSADTQAQALDRLPLHSLSALRPHLDTLHRLGCTRLGELRPWPRAAVARRWGWDLVQALDEAYGERAETHVWVQPSEPFVQQLLWEGSIEQRSGLLFAGQRLLRDLRVWLQQRQMGVLHLRMTWTYDRRRGETQQDHLDIRCTAVTQDIQHLGRLMGERLAQATWLGPVEGVELHALETAPHQPPNESLLQERPSHETLAWPALVERLQARLGESRVRFVSRTEPGHHRPGDQQRWHTDSAGSQRPGTAPVWDAAWQPLALLNEPQALPLSMPEPSGQLRPTGFTDLGAKLRIETGWWQTDAAPTRRLYRVASHPAWGWVWVYQDLTQPGPNAYLHGLYG